ncbi:hypothetical protein L1987_80742 [Smallanthus sonchifolius]|uniref:Uncharacterized protein n=1 Tax=Smallanthus sonchifolius TaxID=185202 RepID=A0ACB8YMW9_9ASTR|nr:hypothetical protein L1987_80742 [Smallanthus sonchifolius]
MDKRNVMAEASDMTTGYLRNSNLQTDGEDQDSSTVIIGYCPDMCPGNDEPLVYSGGSSSPAVRLLQQVVFSSGSSSPETSADLISIICFDFIHALISL